MGSFDDRGRRAGASPTLRPLFRSATIRLSANGSPTHMRGGAAVQQHTEIAQPRIESGETRAGVRDAESRHLLIT